jgi:hypothetical protein
VSPDPTLQRRVTGRVAGTGRVKHDHGSTSNQFFLFFSQYGSPGDKKDDTDGAKSGSAHHCCRHKKHQARCNQQVAGELVIAMDFQAILR